MRTYILRNVVTQSVIGSVLAVTAPGCASHGDAAPSEPPGVEAPTGASSADDTVMTAGAPPAGPSSGTYAVPAGAGPSTLRISGIAALVPFKITFTGAAGPGTLTTSPSLFPGTLLSSIPAGFFDGTGKVLTLFGGCPDVSGAPCFVVNFGGQTVNIVAGATIANSPDIYIAGKGCNTAPGATGTVTVPFRQPQNFFVGENAVAVAYGGVVPGSYTLTQTPAGLIAATGNYATVTLPSGGGKITAVKDSTTISCVLQGSDTYALQPDPIAGNTSPVTVGKSLVLDLLKNGAAAAGLAPTLSTTCSGATVSLGGKGSAGFTTLTFTAGASTPAPGNCVVTATVAPATPATFVVPVVPAAASSSSGGKSADGGAGKATTTATSTSGKGASSSSGGASGTSTSGSSATAGKSSSGGASGSSTSGSTATSGKSTGGSGTSGSTSTSGSTATTGKGSSSGGSTAGTSTSGSTATSGKSSSGTSGSTSASGTSTSGSSTTSGKGSSSGGSTAGTSTSGTTTTSGNGSSGTSGKSSSTGGSSSGGGGSSGGASSSGGGSTSGGKADGGGSCTSPATLCGAECANLNTDPLNCGKCGNTCAVGDTCCAGTCVNTADTNTNCGVCGNSCAAGSVCCDGACQVGATCTCEPTCEGSLSCCSAQTGSTSSSSGSCVNELSDSNNCGKCGEVCNTAAGSTCCNGACTDVQGSATNCGACGVTCATGSVCCDGACEVGTSCSCGAACGADDTCCTSGSGPDAGATLACTNTLTDPNNCSASGKCGFPCTVGDSCCAGTCIDEATDPANCGGCGVKCEQGEICCPLVNGQGVQTGSCVAGTTCVVPDAGADAGPKDAGTTDSGSNDAGAADAEANDAASDSGAHDASLPGDASSPSVDGSADGAAEREGGPEDIGLESARTEDLRIDGIANKDDVNDPGYGWACAAAPPARTPLGAWSGLVAALGTLFVFGGRRRRR